MFGSERGSAIKRSREGRVVGRERGSAIKCMMRTTGHGREAILHSDVCDQASPVQLGPQARAKHKGICNSTP